MADAASGETSTSSRGLSVLARSLRTTRMAWPALTVYQRFEQLVALVLAALVALLVTLALLHLMWRIVLLVIFGLADPALNDVFQTVFGMVMTILIALEFNHSIIGVLERRHGIVRLRTVVLIALLALVRRFIILDALNGEPAVFLGLAASTMALGAVYWLVREQDFREDGDGEPKE